MVTLVEGLWGRSMGAILLGLILSFVSKNSQIVDEVDVVEINRVVDGEAEVVFRQIVFWKWYSIDCNYHVVDWRRYLCEGSILQPPSRIKDKWTFRWKDSKDKCWRVVRSPILRETWTVRDPEVDDREFVPQENRIGLTKP